MIRFEARLQENSDNQFTIDYLDTLKKTHEECKSNRDILQLLCKQHHDMSKEIAREERVSEIVYQKIKTDLDVSRVRSGATEKNTLVILEILNTILMTSSIDEVYLTSDYMSTPYRYSLQHVESMIQARRTRKMSKINE